MFFAGFEIDRNILKEYYKRSTLIGMSSLLTLFTTTFYFMLNLGLKASLLIAVLMSTTSLALVYPALKEKGLFRIKTGHILLSSAMIVDILSIIFIIILFGVVDLYAIVYITIALTLLYIAPKAGKWIFSRYKVM